MKAFPDWLSGMITCQINARIMAFARKKKKHCFISGTTYHIIMTDIKYRGSDICITTPFVVNLHVKMS